jgi:hypothetical protein
MAINALLLVMVAQDDKALAQLGLGRDDAFLQFGLLRCLKTLEPDRLWPDRMARGR